MGILDFFRKKLEEVRSIQKENSREKQGNAEEDEKIAIDFDISDMKKLKTWLAGRKRALAEREKIFLSELKELIASFVLELKEKLEIVEGINLGVRKAEEKIKVIVRENLENYKSHLIILIADLEKLGKDNPYKMLERVNVFLINFRRNSRMSFEKATILIGKELGNIRDSFGKFIENLRELTEKNKGIILESRTLGFAGSRLDEIEKVDKNIEDVGETISSLSERIARFEKEKILVEKELERERTSARHFKFLERTKELEAKEKELEREFSRARESVDFKQLASVFHSSKKKMELVKSYREDFEDAFNKTSGEDLVELVKESGAGYENLKSERDKIIKLKEEIANFDSGEDSLGLVSSRLAKLKAEISEFSMEVERERKKKKKLESSRDETIGSLKERLGRKEEAVKKEETDRV